jgi:hypothetical protein
MQVPGPFTSTFPQATHADIADSINMSGSLLIMSKFAVNPIAAWQQSSSATAASPNCTVEVHVKHRDSQQARQRIPSGTLLFRVHLLLSMKLLSLN